MFTNNSDQYSMEPPMVRCEDCGHQVPAQNITIHRIHGCQGAGRAAVVAETRMDVSHQQPEPMEIDSQDEQNNNTNTSAATAPSLSPDYYRQSLVEIRQRMTQRRSARRRGRQEDGLPSTSPMTLSPPAGRILPRPSWQGSNTTAAVSATPLSPAAGNGNHLNDIGVIDITDSPITSPRDRKPAAVVSIRDGVSASSTSNTLGDREVVDLVFEDDDVVEVVSGDSPRNPRQHQEVNNIENENKSKDEEVASPETEQEWPCPRCTLLNSLDFTHCSACGYYNREIRRRNWAPNNSHNNNVVRAPDPVRRDRLVGENPFDTFLDDESDEEDLLANRRSSMSSPLGYMGGGALLGSVMGTTSALLQGRPLMSAAVNGAFSGAVGGALVREVFEPSSSRAAQARSATNLTNNTGPTTSNSQRQRQQRTSNGNRNIARQMPAGTRLIHTPNGVAIISSLRGRGGRQQQRVTQGDGHGGTPTTGDPMLDFVMAIMNQNSFHGRNIDNMSYEQLLQAFGDGTENMGASEEVISVLPVATVQNPERDLPEDHRQCLICLEEFQTGEKRMTLPCLHGFHDECATKWLLSNGSCPICKHQVNVNNHGGDQHHPDSS